jgi:hypothetical protein
LEREASLLRRPPKDLGLEGASRKRRTKRKRRIGGFGQR